MTTRNQTRHLNPTLCMAGGLLHAADQAPADAVAWPPPGRHILPGMANLHSHAFQRAMAGLAERRGEGDDSFWTWRQTMYGFAARLSPDDLKAIAAQLYVEMLRAGYTQVCEFHYLHHQPDGSAYATPEAMSLALVEAAEEAGIGLTLLPVLYMTGGFDERPLAEHQRRFGHSVEAYARLHQRLRALNASQLTVGMAIHSLRAVPQAPLAEVLADAELSSGPIHIHIAEQAAEVDDCIAQRGARPVRWLLDHAPVDARWCLVHATHMDAGETRDLAHSGAVAGLCPSTEANLGDGLFPLADYLDAGGRFGIGSDSNSSISLVEELRWLEYGQRLRARQRNVAARKAYAHVGAELFAHALQGGAQAAGIDMGRLAPGARADALVLDEDSPWLAAREGRVLLDSLVFAGNDPLVRDVMVAGRWQVRDFQHRDQARIAARYRQTVQRLARS
ncbi:formimidoylglutamate deiminase [Oleiagrimonas sp. C23AA]|uniref:formimidoylglutamate deiminase n=1 Tax=Oleiagrimonas sp. C23AA TaxID=2719047 RepID=UPI001421C702|nr:formimidoylglutamate deiminase [Oleiagrimonas sp. C23AA]NII09247.1 formimidoylglutamate deiminase [Oleiagrimonas sp. C23AA]